MGWDAGSIESTLDVDLSPFDRGLEEAKAKAREFADKRYTATVDINARRSDEELAAVERRLHSIESSVDRIGNKASGGSGNGRGGLFSRLGNLPNPSMMGLGIAAAIPATVPFAGLAGGIAGGALSAGASGLLGLGAFGLGAKSSVTTITGDITKLNKLTAQYNAATTNKQRAAVLVKEQGLWKSLDPAQRQAVKNVQSLDDAWARYKKRLEPQTFAVVADGAKIANTGLKYLLPTAQAVGDEVDLLAKRAERAFKAPFWHQFFGDFLPGEADRSVDALGTTLGNVGTGVAHLVQDFAPLAHLLEGGSTSLSGRFEKWTEGAGPGKFVAWVEKEGPPAAKALEGLAKGVTGLAKGFAPIGSVELKALTLILSFIGKLGDEQPGVITALGAAYLSVAGGLKAIAAVRGLGGVLGVITGLGRGKTPGGLGGGGGGILGKGTPVPVYVTNWEGGPHVPGSPGKTVAKDVEKGIQKGGEASLLSRVGSVASKVLPDAGRVAKFGGPALVAGLIIDDQLNPGPPLHQNVTKDAQRSPAVMKRYAALLAQAEKANPLGGLAISGLAQEKLLTQALHDVGVSEAGVGKAARGSANDLDIQKSSVAHLRAEFATLGPAILRSLGALQKLPGYLRTAEADALSGGFVIGDNLAKGITIGIQQGGGKVSLTTVSVVKGALHAAHNTAQLGSPSRITTQYGRWMAEGLAVGFTGFSAQLDKAFSGTTKTALNRLGTHVNNAANQLRADLQSRADLGSSITGNIMSGASLANATLSNTGNATVGGFLSDQISQLTPFKAALDKLKKKHLDPRLIQQIADAGPQQGLALAQSILSGESGSISSINKQEKKIAGLAGGIGSTVAGAVFAPQIGKDQAALVKMVNQLERVITKKLDLSPHAELMMERAFIRALRQAFPSLSLKELGHAGAIKIRTAR